MHLFEEMMKTPRKHTTPQTNTPSDATKTTTAQPPQTHHLSRQNLGLCISLPSDLMIHDLTVPEHLAISNMSGLPGRVYVSVRLPISGQSRINRCSFFAYSWKLPAYIELFYLQLTSLAFLLTIEAFCLQLELFCLQWESASNKGLKGL